MEIDWSKIETVLLDMDGTLLDLHFDNYFWRQHLPKVYSEHHDLPHQESLSYLEPLFKSHQGTLNWYCVDFWSEQLGLDIMQHKSDVAHKIGYRPQAREFLKNCQQQVSDLRLITNAHRKVLNLKIQYTGLDQYFHQDICSHELGAAKEDQQFWIALNQLQAFDPQKTLFIDDSETVLDAANEYGIEYLFSIAKPDSQNHRRSASKYPMIEAFPHS